MNKVVIFAYPRHAVYKKLKHPERPFTLHVFIGEELSAIRVRMNRQKNRKANFTLDYFEIDHNDEAAAFDLSDELPGHYAIVLRKKPTVGAICHECFHVVAKHMEWIGQKLTPDTEEAYAYMMSWLTEEIWKVANK